MIRLVTLPLFALAIAQWAYARVVRRQQGPCTLSRVLIASGVMALILGMALYGAIVYYGL